MVEEKSVRRKDIVVGLGAGLGVGIFVLVSVLLLLRPSDKPEPAEATPAVETLPTATGEPGALPTTMALPTPTPEEVAPVETTQATTTVTYTVQPGDTLGEISLEFGVSMESIQAANNLQGVTIYVDQELVIYLDENAVVALTATPTEEATREGVIIHEVVAGDTLSEIAVAYGVTVDEILAANDLDSDVIWVGQELIIPTNDVTPTLEPEASNPWTPSILEGDLASAYPSVVETDRFTVHYVPDTYPADDIDAVEAMIGAGLAHIEDRLQTSLDGEFDVYVAGSLFAPPDAALRGRSFSTARRYHFLHDGTGNTADQQYIATHELTHLFSWNVFGKPVSAMLSEGVAVYTGMTRIADADHMSIETFCAAYHEAEALPLVSSNLRYDGHIRDLQNYYAAGCFVQYLIEMYGPEKFGELYSTGNYSSIYGKSLATLEAAWIADIEYANVEIPFDPADLVAAVDAVSRSYDTLFDDFDGTPAEMSAYEALDAARIALLEGEFDTMEQRLAEFQQALES